MDSNTTDILINSNNNQETPSPYVKMRPETVQFTERLEHYAREYFLNLAKFKQSYVFYHKNPEYEEYQKNFVDSKSQLQSINKSIFLLANAIQVKIERLNAYITDINKKLMDDKVYYSKLNVIYKNIGNTEHGSATLIDDYKKTYNEVYLNSFNMFIGIIIVCGTTFSVFKNSTLKEGVKEGALKISNLIKSKIPGSQKYKYKYKY
uniref:Uncharacterized protein n=1 Tax=viral metagenome TaxID=1070528 RepID=A0A6C0F3E4_9ZZZZ